MFKGVVTVITLALIPTLAYGTQIDSLKIELSQKQALRDSLSKQVAFLDSTIGLLKTAISRRQYQSQLGVELILTMEGKLRPEPKSFSDHIAIVPKGTKVKATWYGRGFFKVQTPNHGEGYLGSVYIKETDVVKIFMKDEEAKREAEQKIENDKLAEEATKREAEMALRSAREKKKREAAEEKALEEAAAKYTKEMAEARKISAKLKQQSIARKNRERRDMANKYQGVLAQSVMNEFHKGRLAIGMPEDMVLFIAGWPSDRNVTKSKYSTREQWIYKNPKSGWKYLYMVNGILDTMQN